MPGLYEETLFTVKNIPTVLRVTPAPMHIPLSSSTPGTLSRHYIKVKVVWHDIIMSQALFILFDHLMASLVIQYLSSVCISLNNTYFFQKYKCVLHCITDKKLIDMIIYEAKLTPQSPTNVCVKCYDEAQLHNNTQRLPWLECARPTDHAKEDRITVIVGDNHTLVEVEDIPSCLLRCPPSQLSLCRKITQPKGCSGACNSAHSYEELQYWKWSIVHNSMPQENVMSSHSHVYIIYC